MAACRPPPLGTHCSGRSEAMVAAGDGVRLGPVRLSCPGGGRAGCAELAGPHALGQPASPSSSKQSGHGRAVAGASSRAMAARLQDRCRPVMPCHAEWATRSGSDWRRRRRGPQVRQERGQADASIAEAHHPARPLHSPAGAIQPRTLPTHRRPSVKRPGDPPVTALLQPSGAPEATPGRHDPSACRERRYNTQRPRDQ